MNIAVLLGGTSAERYVSMATGKGVAEALAERGHNVRLYDVALGENAEIIFDDLVLPTEVAPSPEELAQYNHRDVITAIQNLPDNTDVVFIALHGADGEDGKIQALLDLHGIPYTGSGVLASALAIHKAKSKEFFRIDDISTPNWFLLEPDDEVTQERLNGLVEQITDYPVVVKPNDGGSTVGLTIVKDADGLIEAVEFARKYSSDVLFEEFVEGRELTVALLDGEPLPVLEIKPKSGIYDYTNKYTAGRTEYFCPADIPLALSEELHTLALKAHELLGCKGYSRVDFRLDEHNEPWCLEVNTLPGMTGTSLVPKAAKAVGIEYGELCDRIVEATVRKEVVVGESGVEGSRGHESRVWSQ
ncbi:MAG: D-alanine--D-alanine ligase [Chlorobi bacterium]|nr:D-alanine--D-alanine ligase [Chlorobiota bacterium]